MVNHTVTWWNDTWKLPKEERWKVRSATFAGIAEAYGRTMGLNDKLCHIKLRALYLLRILVMA